MKEITILSGKGGTGKTSVTAALASVAQNAVFCDNDVDAADLHLIFEPIIKERHPFSSGAKAMIDPEICSRCGICMENCRFDAIHKNADGSIEIDQFKCEGCRLCERICPVAAVTSTLNTNNTWFVSDTRFGELVHAEMGPGEENSGNLVTQIRKKANALAQAKNADFVISDGPPGIGCATIASLTGTNTVLLVIEPSQSGLHDARRLVELIESFGIETFAVINKFDINLGLVKMIEEFLSSKNIPLLAKIPFDKIMVEAMIEGKNIIEYDADAAISKMIGKVWDSLKVSKK